MKRRGQPDPVSPELAAYVIRRDGGCVPARRIQGLGLCRGRLTVAHVRDRGLGGRAGKRPPSVPRHLVACCEGHHLDDPLVDRPEVRDDLDRYLEDLEGPATMSGNRPHEAIPRIRPRAMVTEDDPAGPGSSARTKEGSADASRL